MKKISIKSSIRDYDVILSYRIEDCVKNYDIKKCKYVVFADSNLSNSLISSVAKYFNNALIIKIKGGESAKTLMIYNAIIHHLLENNISKTDKLVALGGGTILDLIGYVALTYKRGISYISIPTTTLAMIDASIGGKVGLNFNQTKNVIGGFNPPEVVLNGFDILITLDEKNMNNGLFEAIKIGILDNEKILDCFAKSTYFEDILDIIEMSIASKKKFVELDEFDQNERRFLNFGHTIGHAIELNYSLLHGEAIANGMLILSKGKPYYSKLETALKILKCPVVNIKNKEEIIKNILNDKKIENGFLNLVTVEEIGHPKFEKVNLNNLKEIF